MELLHIISSHEHYVVLNLPFPSMNDTLSPSPSISSLGSSASSTYSMMVREHPAIAELSVHFRQQHYLVGLVLCELKNTFDSK